MSKQKMEYDVAIVGVGVGANYGSVLTYYSLYKAIESFGNKVLMVSKIGASANDPELNNTHAIRWAKRHYNLSKLYSQNTVHELNQLAKIFVIGSDQVWNYGISAHFGKAFYLDFAEDDKGKVSYAASFGHAKDFAPAEEVEKISTLMKRFDAISVREDSGVRIARDIYTVDATQVAEPIFLTDVEAYKKLGAESTRDTSEPYLLAYILDPAPEKKRAIEHIARKKSLKIRIILDAWPHLFEENRQKMDIEGAVEEGIDTYDFLKLYDNCDYVVTDSFHGTSFAVKFEKPFAAIGNKRRGMARFDSMFKLIGHRERFTVDPLKIIENDEVFLSNPNYSEITEALSKHVDHSKAWLSSSLKLRNAPKNPSIVTESNRLDVSRLYSKTSLKLSKQIRAVTRSVQNTLRRHSMTLSAPEFFEEKKAWKITKGSDVTDLRVAGPEFSVRGNVVWTNLPQALREGSAYELKIAWSVKTSFNYVNIHIRNPTTKKFIVVGTIFMNNRDLLEHHDTISFVIPKAGFSQIMLGAMHFQGNSAGARVREISLKSILPESVVPNAAPVQSATLRKDASMIVKDLSEGDAERFLSSYAQHMMPHSHQNARSILMFYSHGFEKGLSRTGNFRPGFGQATMPKFAWAMNKWVNDKKSTEDIYFKIAASVLKVYFERHKKIGFDVANFWKMFDAPVQAAIESADLEIGGAIAAGVDREPIVAKEKGRDFIDVVYGRRSVRDFTDQPVSNDDIRAAVQIAMQAPSVCNRQSARVHLFEDKLAMQAALDLQGGFGGYKMPPRLLLITSDLNSFLFAAERRQPFVDGGLFMMNLLLGLEQVGLGGCSLNTAMNAEKETAIRKILGIPDHEVFIAFVAAGHYDPAVLVPRSKRVPVEDVLIMHTNKIH